MEQKLKINHLAVWVCVILLFVLGFLWYGPLFGDQWMDMVGLVKAEVEADPPGAGIWISNAISTIIPMYVLAWLFIKLKVTNGLNGLLYGLIISFSFVFLSKLTSDMFAQNPYGLSWITGGYDMVALSLSGLILGAWRKYEK